MVDSCWVMYVPHHRMHEKTDDDALRRGDACIVRKDRVLARLEGRILRLYRWKIYPF